MWGLAKNTLEFTEQCPRFSLQPTFSPPFVAVQMILLYRTIRNECDVNRYINSRSKKDVSCKRNATFHAAAIISLTTEVHRTFNEDET